MRQADQVDCIHERTLAVYAIGARVDRRRVQSKVVYDSRLRYNRTIKYSCLYKRASYAYRRDSAARGMQKIYTSYFVLLTMRLNVGEAIRATTYFGDD